VFGEIEKTMLVAPTRSVDIPKKSTFKFIKSKITDILIRR
tara:strand:- start:1548 stop:1667 length:120 start_codon:yes stop_codon:yes gene_type:complete